MTGEALSIVLFRQSHMTQDATRIEAISFVDRTKGLEIFGDFYALVLEEDTHHEILSAVEQGCFKQAQELLLGLLRQFTSATVTDATAQSSNWFMDHSDSYGPIVAFQALRQGEP